jgi:hypothetical protein
VPHHIQTIIRKSRPQDLQLKKHWKRKKLKKRKNENHTYILSKNYNIELIVIYLLTQKREFCKTHSDAANLDSRGSTCVSGYSISFNRGRDTTRR